MRGIKQEDIQNLNYYQTPKWLFDLLQEGKITPGSFCLYMLMYDRLRISSENGWIDENGNVYITYSWDSMRNDRKVKSNTQIKRDIEKLEELNLLDKKKRYGNSSVFYLNIYSEQNDSITQNDSPIQSVSSSSIQSVSSSSIQSVETNKNKSIKNKSINNNFCQTDKQEGNPIPVRKITQDEPIPVRKFAAETDISKSTARFLETLMNQSIRFTTHEKIKIIGYCEQIGFDPMVNYARSLYLQGKAEIQPTKRMFLRFETWEKMALGDYDDKQPKKATRKEPEPFKQTVYSKPDDSFLSEIFGEEWNEEV